MLSYAQEVKNELARKLDDASSCRKAEFVALMRGGARQVEGRLEFVSSNAAAARKVIVLAKKFLPHAVPEVASVRRKRLSKNLLYIVRFIATAEARAFFDNLDLDKLTTRTRSKIAYLRGAFLAAGTVNRPEGAYMLETVTEEAEALFIRKLLNRLDFRAGIYRRKKKFVVWLREADAICDFLGMVGADNALERFEVARNVKEVRRQVNRLVNMETAALNKAIEAAQRQLADIQVLIDNDVPVKKVIRETMKARLENPSCTVSELAEKLSITRVGLHCRFKIIHRLAEKYGKK